MMWYIQIFSRGSGTKFALGDGWQIGIFGLILYIFPLEQNKIVCTRIGSRKSREREPERWRGDV